jgi:hypothetical protein
MLYQFIHDPDSDDHLAMVVNHLGSLEQDLGHYRAAETMYRQAIQLRESVPGAAEARGEAIAFLQGRLLIHSL